MYVAEYETSTAPLAPESRTEFYKRVTEELLIKRRLQQTGKTSAPGKLREQRERILGRLAYEHLIDARQPSNSLHWSDAMKVIKSVLKCDNETAEIEFRGTCKRNRSRDRRAPQRKPSFYHLTFCEFLAAFEAIQGHKDGWNSIVRSDELMQKEENPQSRSRSLEVIPFAAGLLPRVRRPDAMTEISHSGNFRLIARCFLETKPYEHES
jgi:hypothetical protein